MIINDRLKWQLDVNVFMTPIAQTNWNTNTVSSSTYNGFRASSGAQNDSITFWLTLAAGTWDIEVMYYTGTANGIITVKVDGVSQGTIDTYAASMTASNRTALTGLSIGSAGKKVLQLVMATKHASSTNYAGEIQHIQLRRTA